MKIFIMIIICLSLSSCSSGSSAENYDRITHKKFKVFEENFENNTLKNINLEAATNHSFTLLKDFKDKDNTMLKVTLHKGDFVNNGHRAEFKKEVNEKVGDEMVYKIDFMIDKQYKDSKKMAVYFSTPW